MSLRELSSEVPGSPSNSLIQGSIATTHFRKLFSVVMANLILCSLCVPQHTFAKANQIVARPVLVHVFLNEAEQDNDGQNQQNDEGLGTAMVSLTMTATTTSPLQFTVYFDVDRDGVFTEDEKGVDAVPAFAEQKLPDSFPILFADPDKLQILLKDKLRRIKVKVVVQDMDGIVLETDELVARRVEEHVEDILTFEPGFIGSMHRPRIHNAVGPGRMSSPATSPQDPNVNIFNKDVPDINARRGKMNECVPISAANSLLWLAAKHNFTNKLPPRADDLIDEIAKDVKWTERGTKPENFLPGKKKLTSDRSLELENKRIDAAVSEGASDVWDKIVSELQAGEDVELVIDFKESPNSALKNSHSVTVVGASSKGNNQYITVHDSVNGPSNDTYRVRRDGVIEGHPLGKGFGTFIISESFKKRT